MKIIPLHSMIVFSSSVHLNANLCVPDDNSVNPINPRRSQNSINQNIQRLLSSFFEMWLPMFIAMAIKIPKISSLTKFIRIPLEIVLKALTGFGLSEIIKLITKTNSVSHH